MCSFWIYESNNNNSLSPYIYMYRIQYHTVSFLIEGLLVFLLYFACIVHSKNWCSALWSSWWTAAAGSDDAIRTVYSIPHYVLINIDGRKDKARTLPSCSWQVESLCECSLQIFHHGQLEHLINIPTVTPIACSHACLLDVRVLGARRERSSSTRRLITAAAGRGVGVVSAEASPPACIVNSESLLDCRCQSCFPSFCSWLHTRPVQI